MKKSLLFPLLLCSIFAWSQMDELLNNEWRFVNYDYECFGSGPINPDEFGVVTLEFIQQDNIIYFHSQMCASMDGTVDVITNSTIKFGNLIVTGSSCSQSFNELYEDCYSSTFGNEFNYEIIENEDGSLNLIMSNDIFMGIMFTTQQLSTAEITKNIIQISPNPVNDKLTIQNSDSKKLNVQITDTNGKLLFNQKINSDKTEINFSNYPKGIYFVTFESEGKIIKNEKIIKK